MYEIFISYCTDDNAALAWEKFGWIDIFQDSLNKRLNVYCGRERRPQIWFDKRRIDGNERLSHTIEGALKEAVLLVAVISPSYVTSEWCRTELTTFSKALKASPQAGGRSRVLKVVKVPVPDQSFLETIPELSDCRGYDFFKLVEGGPPAELNPLRNPDHSSEFTDAIDKLAKSLLDTLGVVGRASSTGRKVFLAGSSRDISLDADQLRKELEMFGHSVVRPPFESLPDDETEYRAELRELLARCDLSIHPVGKFYGTVPEGYELSPIAIQYSVALEEAARRAEFRALSWMSPSVEPKDERQQNFVKMLETQGPRFHRVALEDFKTRVRDALAQPAAPAPRPTAAVEADRPSVYLICDQRDREENVRAVANLLKGRYSVVRSLFDRELRDLRERYLDDLEKVMREDHQRHLTSCDAVLIFHGEGDQLWLRRMLLEVRNARGFGRQRPFGARAVLLAAPPTSDKEQYDNNEMLVLDALSELSPALFEPFDAAIRRSREQTG